jgi:hypothetical protein
MHALLIIGSGAVGAVIGAAGGLTYAEATRQGDYDFGALFTVPAGAVIGGAIGVTFAALRWAS